MAPDSIIPTGLGTSFDSWVSQSLTLSLRWFSTTLPFQDCVPVASPHSYIPSIPLPEIHPCCSSLGRLEGVSVRGPPVRRLDSIRPGSIFGGKSKKERERYQVLSGASGAPLVLPRVLGRKLTQLLECLRSSDISYKPNFSWAIHTLTGNPHTRWGTC